MDTNNQEQYETTIYRFGSRLSLIFITIAIVGFLILLLPLFLKDYDFNKLGVLGDATGGFLNPIVAIAAALLTFLAFYVQYSANMKIQEQFRIQSANDHFYKMLDLYLGNIEGFKIKSHYNTIESSKEFHNDSKSNEEIKSVEIEKFVEYDRTTIGKDCFVLMLKDIHFSIERCFNIRSKFKLSIEDELLLQLAYRVFFWGTNSKHIYPPNLNATARTDVKIIIKELDEIRVMQRNNKEKKIHFSYRTNDNQLTKTSFRFIGLSGHSTRLAHYYRQLYQTAKHIHATTPKHLQEKEFLDKKDIDFRFVTLRGQMTNEEQLLLYYNYRYGFGPKWDVRYDSGKVGSAKFRFLTKYLMLHNIPLYDTMHSLAQNPIKQFQPYKDKFTDADLFEWGGYD